MPRSRPAPIPSDPAALRAACRRWRLLTVIQVASLILLGSLWELWLAPLRPGGSMLGARLSALDHADPAVPV